MGTDLAKNELDAKILRLAGNYRSFADISEEIGGVLSPLEVGSRLDEILTNPDWLTDIKEERILRWKMAKLLETLEDRYQDLDTIRVQLQILKSLGDRFDKRREASAQDVSTYNTNVGKQLGHVVDLALSYMKGALREQIDAEAWDALVIDAMAMARKEIQKKQIDG